MTTAKEVLGLIAQLSPEEMRKLRQALRYIKVEEEVQPGDQPSDTLAILANVLKKAGLEFRDLGSLRRSQYFPAFRDKSEKLWEYLEMASSDKTKQMAILSFGIRLLVDNIRSMNYVPVSAHVVMQQIHRVPSVLDQAFPGYAEFGLLGKVVTMEEDNDP